MGRVTDLRNRRLLLLCGAAAFLALSFLALPASAGPTMSPPGPNLLPNPGFEQAQPAQVPAADYQPVVTECQCNALPVGWIYEGAAELFSMSTVDPHSGHYDVVISGSLSGGRQLCEVEGQIGCVSNPTNAAKEAARPYYSLPPTWLTQSPIPVKAGQAYLLTSWVAWSTEDIGQGVTLQVRWLDANGLPISQVAVRDWRSTAANNLSQKWADIGGTVVAPSGAASADVLLGATDDAWIGQVRFDDAYFGLAPHPIGH